MKRLTHAVKCLGRIITMLSPTCTRAVRLQSADLDLMLLQRLGLSLHLLVCKWCRGYGRQIRLLRHQANHRPLPPPDPRPARLSEAARRRITDRLRRGPD